MSLKDLPAHNRGRRHQLALSKVDASLRPLPESVDTAPAVNRHKDTQGRGIVGSDKTTSTARHFNSLATHDSAGLPVGSSASETVTGSTFPTETVKQNTNKAKRSKEVKIPKSIVNSTATPPASRTNEYVFHTSVLLALLLWLWSIGKLVIEIRLMLHQHCRLQPFPSPPWSHSYYDEYYQEKK